MQSVGSLVCAHLVKEKLEAKRPKLSIAIHSWFDPPPALEDVFAVRFSPIIDTEGLISPGLLHITPSRNGFQKDFYDPEELFKIAIAPSDSPTDMFLKFNVEARGIIEARANFICGNILATLDEVAISGTEVQRTPEIHVKYRLDPFPCVQGTLLCWQYPSFRTKRSADEVWAL
jgi:hypothetical protein